MLDHLFEPHADIGSRIVMMKRKAQRDLAKVCEQEKADLIVMATHGPKPLMRNIVGSVTERFIAVGVALEAVHLAEAVVAWREYGGAVADALLLGG